MDTRYDRDEVIEYTQRIIDAHDIYTFTQEEDEITIADYLIEEEHSYHSIGE